MDWASKEEGDNHLVCPPGCRGQGILPGAGSHTSSGKVTYLILRLRAVVSPHYCFIKVFPHLITSSTKKLYSVLCNLRSQPLHLLMPLSAMLNSLAGPDFFL